MSGPATAPKTAMVMAAGLGLRMRPLTERRPKALVEVGGRALIDHILDRLEAAGVTRAVVNVHAFADQLEDHLGRRRSPEILISDERNMLLETGGGLKRARSMLGEAPIWVANSDYVWMDGRDDALKMVADAWDPARMDACLIVVPKARTAGFDTPGDFFRDDAGRLAHRADAPEAPLHCFGVEIIDPQRVYEIADEKFSLFRVWQAASAQGRLFGVVPDGYWMQVGDPAALAAAEARLKEAA
ncbi:MAG TPA: nucleotidyltransferase family protein [Caulobacteraceae bacterium]|nr:nucleotidyltransferase family protein [Caulobacteraceae bacterium]